MEGLLSFHIRCLGSNRVSPQVRGIYTDGELTLDVAAFGSGLVKRAANQHPRLGLHTQRLNNDSSSGQRLSKIAHMQI